MVTIREMRCLFPTDYWFSEKILMFFSEKMLNDVCQCLLILFPGESSQDDIYVSLIFRSPIHSHFCSLEAQLESGVEGTKNLTLWLN